MNICQTLHQPPPYQPLHQIAHAVVCLALDGTGSTFPMNHSMQWSQFIRPRVSFIAEVGEASTSCASRRPDVRSAKEHLENIRARLSPAISDLTSTFEVSRQAIYKWLSGESKPEPEKSSRIVALSQIADSFSQAGVSRGGSLLKMKTMDNRSLLDIVAQGEDWHDTVQLLIAESQAMERAYERSGLAKSKANPTNDWLASQSIPTPCEEV